MEQIMEMMAEIIATQRLMLAGMEAGREERTAHQETAVNAFQEKMDAWIASRKDGIKEMTACQEATKTEPNPGMM
jgi:hypothetical protein